MLLVKATLLLVLPAAATETATCNCGDGQQPDLALSECSCVSPPPSGVLITERYYSGGNCDGAVEASFSAEDGVCAQPTNLYKNIWTWEDGDDGWDWMVNMHVGSGLAYCWGKSQAACEAAVALVQQGELAGASSYETDDAYCEWWMFRVDTTAEGRKPECLAEYAVPHGDAPYSLEQEEEGCLLSGCRQTVTVSVCPACAACPAGQVADPTAGCCQCTAAVPSSGVLITETLYSSADCASGATVSTFTTPNGGCEPTSDAYRALWNVQNVDGTRSYAGFAVADDTLLYSWGADQATCESALAAAVAASFGVGYYSYETEYMLGYMSFVGSLGSCLG